jgi:ABC-type nickel/cobalt efflux system permease component RcnA
MKPIRFCSPIVAAIPLLFLVFPAILLAAPSAARDLGETNVFGILGLGFLLGLKHALDADHLVAVSTMVSERSSAWSAAFVGGMWGIGHTASLLIAGVLIVFLRPQLPDYLAPALEFGVAAMILGLGLNLLLRIIRRGRAELHIHAHSHGDLNHWHPHLHYADSHEERSGNHHWIHNARKPFLVGMMHGLAGSATLVLLVLAEVRTPIVGLLYLLVFGVGSIGGMLVMSMLFALPYGALKNRFGRFDVGLRLTASVFSILFGAYMMYEIALTTGLLKIAR